jgi:predicted PurR-regulated permease PerM
VLVVSLLVYLLIPPLALRPEPLVPGLTSLFPPRRREHVQHVLGRLRTSWIGWMEGVAIDMLVTFVLLYIGLTVIGVNFAIFVARSCSSSKAT